MLKKIVISLTLLLFIPVSGQALTVKARVDKTRMTFEDTLSLTVTITDGDADVDTSAIQDFKVMGHSTGSNFQWINGKSSVENTHFFSLSPLKKGTLVIPALAVHHKGEIYSTDKIEIVVGDSPVSAAESDDIFIRARVNHSSIYPGQQLVYTFSLYFAVQISNPSLQIPDFKGFSVKESDKDTQSTTLVNGREYQLIERNIILDPLKAGKYPIPPSVLTCHVVVKNTKRSRDPFDAFFNDSFFGRSTLVKKVFKTKPLTVHVKDLPPNPYPVPFSGLVGRFSLKSGLESNHMKVGDSTTLTLTVAGSGNVSDAAEPDVTVPSGFKLYKDNPEEKITSGKGGFSGKKTFRMALVAVNAGRYTIPPVSYVYFDVEKGVYKVLSSTPYEIDVGPSPDGSTTAMPSADPAQTGGLFKKKVEYTGHDILPLKESLDGVVPCFELSPIGFTLCLVIPLLGLGLVKIIVLYSGRGKTTGAMMAERADKALKTAGGKGISDEQFLANVYLAFVSRVFSRAHVTGESLTAREVRSILESSGCNGQVVSDAESLLSRIESLRFGGETMDDEAKKSLLEDTRKMIRRIG